MVERGRRPVGCVENCQQVLLSHDAVVKGTRRPSIEKDRGDILFGYTVVAGSQGVPSVMSWEDAWEQQPNRKPRKGYGLQDRENAVMTD